MFKCPKCEKPYEKLISLSLHYRRGHKLTSKQLYVDLYLNGDIPTCKCGCNEEVKFLGIEAGFREYKRGHISRIENPHIYRTKETFDKVSKTRIEKFKNGELEIWNKGITAEEDERLKIQGEKSSITILNNKKELKTRSKRMRNNRLSGIVPTLSGKDHSQWKGGTSSISSRCHGNTRLYQEWKYPKLKQANFICQRCGSNNKLEVHHNKEKMSEIIDKIMNIHDPDKKDSFELQTKIMDEVIDYHIDNDVSGEVICHECHKEEHPSYNYKI